MSKKTREKRKAERQRIKEWHKYYELIIATEKDARKGYEELAKLHSAYITMLLQKLGATEENPITIKASEVTEALKKYEARAMQAEDGFSLYCEEVKFELKETDFDIFEEIVEEMNKE